MLPFCYSRNMRERRKKEGNRVLFDYRDLLNKKKNSNKTLLKMKKGPVSYQTEKGVRFFSDHPFQWVAKGHANHLLATFTEDKHIHFVEATIEEVEDYYCD